jgi:hypothetical protein
MLFARAVKKHKGGAVKSERHCALFWFLLSKEAFRGLLNVTALQLLAHTLLALILFVKLSGPTYTWL